MEPVLSSTSRERARSGSLKNKKEPQPIKAKVVTLVLTADETKK